MSNPEKYPADVLSQRLNALQTRILSSIELSGRVPTDVKLMAVSKTQSISAVQAAYHLGIRDFGENYAQEGIDKIISLQQMVGDNTAQWHFIGPIQSNKTRSIAEYFHWVHSIDRLKIAQRLSEQRPSSLLPLNICLQVNISNEVSKSGCQPAEALMLAQHICALPRLQLRGLMCIPAPISPIANDTEKVAPFTALAHLHQQIKAVLPCDAQQQFDTLSMGMSNDFSYAIAAGATIIRIGSTLFGARDYSHIQNPS